MSNYSRFRTRKFLYQMLYAQCFSWVNIIDLKESFFSWVFESNLDEKYLTDMFDIILKNEIFFIEIIKKYAPKFNIETMDLACVLTIFISIWEIFFYSEQIPIKVSINEAVEISKVYWDNSSKKMVNWVLNNFVGDIETIKQDIKNIDYNIEYKWFLKK